MSGETGKAAKGPLILAGFLALVGAALAVGGFSLIAAGGSPYYVLTGLAVLVSAFGLLRRARWAAWAYGAMLAATVPWSLWEGGLDPWALMPRLGGPTLIGLLFLLPAVTRRSGGARAWIAGPALASLAVLGLDFLLPAPLFSI